MTRRTFRLSWIAPWLAVALGAPLAAQNGVVIPRVPCERLPGAACHELTLDLLMPSGRKASLSFFFERAVNLTKDSFKVVAREVSPDDPTITQRLPPGVFINGTFPLFVTIDPNRSAPLLVKFRGAWRLELETDALEFEGATTKIYQAHDDNDTFGDVTKSVGFGSYRVSGDGGDFSQFLLVTDMRPPAQIALANYDRLAADIDAGESAKDLSAALALLLRADLKTSRDAFTAVPPNRVGALIALNSLLQRVVEGSGNGVSEEWDRTTPGAPAKVSRAGVLRGDAAALRLSVELAQRITQSRAKGSIVRTLDTPLRLPFQVTVEFPDEVDDLAALNITATDINRKDPALLSRLPKNVSIPAAFPVLINVTPKSGRRPTFREAVSVEVVTEELALLNNSNLRLFKAENGQADFRDISTTFGVGSYRVSGDGGDFSQFLIVEDRRSFTDVLKDKFDRLEGQLDALEPVITSPELFADLVELVALARSHADRRRQTQAIATLDELVALLKANGGGAVPDIWRAGGPGGAGARTSGGGNLIASARTLQLTLTLQKNSRKQLEP